MLPFLLIILHFSQIGLTDDLTFTVKSSFQKKAEYYSNIAFVKLQVLIYRIYKFIITLGILG